MTRSLAIMMRRWDDNDEAMSHNLSPLIVRIVPLPQAKGRDATPLRKGGIEVEVHANLHKEKKRKMST